MMVKKYISWFLAIFLLLGLLSPLDRQVSASEVGQDSKISIIGGGVPTGMFFAPTYLNIQQQRLYVADSKNNRIQAFIRGNVFQLAFGGYGQNEREFDQPAGICTTEDELYIVDSLNARIQIFDSKGNYRSQFGSFGNEPGNFNTPTDIATDGSNLFVLDTGNARVQIFDRTGKYLSSFGSQGVEDGFFNKPLGIETAKGKIYVSDTGNNRVQIFSDAGSFISVFGFSGTEEKGFHKPKGITFHEEKVYIVDSGNKRIHVYDENGVYQSVLALPETKSPFGVSILDNKILVSDSITNEIVTYTFDGKQNGFFGEKPDYSGRFVKPIAVSTTEKEIYVLDAHLKTVQVFDEHFEPITYFSFEEMKKADLYNPVDISVYDGHVYIVDEMKPAISVFTTSGSFVRSIGSYGTEPGTFISPQGICLYDDKIYLSDSGNSRVQVLTLQGDPLLTFGSFGSKNNQFFNMKGIAVIENSIFVTDSGNSRIIVYDIEGNYVNSYGKKGFETGNYFGPNGIHVDMSGKVYIADMLNNRIQILNSITDQSKVFGQFGSIFQDPENYAKGKTDYRYDLIPGYFVYPTDVTVFQNYIAVVDPYNVRVQMIPFSSVFEKNPLSLTPDFLDFGSVGSSTFVTRTFVLRNTGGNYIEGNITCDQDFVTIEPTHFKGSSEEVSLTVKGDSLEAGKKYEAKVIVTLLDGQSKELSLVLHASSEPDFYAEITPFFVASAEEELRVPIKVYPQNGFEGLVTFSAIELPKNTLPTFDPPSVNLPDTDTTYLILKSSSDYIEAGEYRIEVRADSAKGNKSHRFNSTFVFKQKLDLVPHTVLGELFTATWCLNCVYSHMAMDQLYEEMGKETVTFIEYYVDSTSDHPVPRLSWIESEQRMKWYMSDKGLPTIFFDGTDYLKGVSTDNNTPEAKKARMYDDYRRKVVEKSKESSAVTISVRSIFDSKRRIGKVHASVNALDNLPYKNPHIYFAVIESHIPYNAVNGDKFHHFVLRDFITPANDDKYDYLGTAMKLPSGDTFGTKGDTFEIDVDFSLLDFFNLANISLVVFVQDNVTKQVLQSATYPVKVINYRSFDVVSDGSLVQKKTKGETGSIQFDIINDGTIRDTYQVRVLNKSLEKWNYTISVDGKKQSGVVPQITLDAFKRSSIQLHFNIPPDAPVHADQEFLFQIDSSTSHHSKELKGYIEVIESRPPGFLLDIEEPADLNVMAGNEETIGIRITPDPFVEDTIELTLLNAPDELASYQFTPPSGTAPLESFLTFAFTDTTAEKDFDLVIQAKAGTIVKTAIVTIHVLRNPDAVPPSLKIAYPSDNLLTNQPNMTITGMTDPTATLTINQTPVEISKNGSFEHSLALAEGINTIDVIAANRKGLQTQETLTITLDVTPPVLTIETDIPEETTKRDITIVGKAEPNCVVTIGDQDILLEEDGSFTYTAQLTHGWNGIYITAIDAASNSTVIEYYVTVINKIVLQIGNQTASVNDEDVVLEAAPYIKNGRTMVPIRFIAESLGAEVGWDNTTKSITIEKEGIVISLQIGNVEAYIEKEDVIGRERITLEAPPEIVSARTFVPLRFVSEAFGASLDWNGDTREITIKQ
jgi:sugar lactone lactonase YvrE